MRLAGKTALITGGTAGIGRAVAEAFAREGARVAISGRDAARGQEVAEAIGETGGKATFIKADLRSLPAVERLAEEAVAALGQVDILVNNAGVYAFAPLDGVTTDEYRRMYDTNVLGLLLTTKTALPFFPAEGGSVINISSVVSTLAPPASSVYASTKGAVDTITKTLAKELGPRKIRVNAVNPGLVITEGTQSAGIVGSDFEKGAVAMTPLGRAGQPEDIAPPVSFLASEDARWITGETIFVSGGAAI